MTSFARAGELADKLKAAGINATIDPRSATPPCVLIPPPDRTYSLSCGYVARWNLVALAPNPGNADAHKALDALVDAVAGQLPIERVSFLSYVLDPASPAMPAYRIEYEEGISS